MEVIGEEEVEVLEEVNTHCKHEDCIYRMHFQGNTEFCAYLLVTDKVRGCPISKCDKYRSGDRKVVLDKGTLAYRWILKDDEF